jgi:hypothetical protein
MGSRILVAEWCTESIRPDGAGKRLHQARVLEQPGGAQEAGGIRKDDVAVAEKHLRHRHLVRELREQRLLLEEHAIIQQPRLQDVRMPLRQDGLLVMEAEFRHIDRQAIAKTPIEESA